MGYEYYGGGTIFYIDGDKREYKTQKQLIAAIEKRLNDKIGCGTETAPTTKP